MNALRFRELKLFAALIFLMLLFVELVCFSLYKLNSGSVFDWRYYPSAFEHTYKSNLPYGWSSSEGLPRPDQAEHMPVCARAFGDSFTYGGDVYQQDVWANIASLKLGCRIENYGVGGFGTDQALVLYESTQTNKSIVILGIYSEMLRRNQAASWLFYGDQKGKALKPFFEMGSQGQLVQRSWPKDASVDSIRNYHQQDAFYQSYDLQFPYFWHLSKSLFSQLKTKLEYKGIFFDGQSKTLPLQLALLDAFTAQVKDRGSEMVLVFYPSILELRKRNLSYRAQLEAYKAKHPNTCVIDTGPALLSVTSNGIKVGDQYGHFNQKGNEIVAAEVVKGLEFCENTKLLITSVKGSN